MKTVIIVLLIATMLLVSCSPAEELPQPEPVQQPAVEPAAVPSAPVETQPEEPQVKQQPLDPEIASLLAKSDEIDSYGYAYSSRVRNQFENYDTAAFSVYVNGNNIKKVYAAPQKLRDNIHYNEVFLDSDAMTAYGICTARSIKCTGLENKAYKVEYNFERLRITPFTVKESVLSSAEIEQQGVFQNRKSSVLRFTDSDGNEERIWVDQFYGMPLKHTIFEVNDGDELVLKEFIFGQFSAANTKKSETTLPVGYEKQD
ncbi:hypothetical protein COV20_04190 [Candidatus Woesearchaeota archaeon CG10_big_fil_rev_8_21_14_0_10_45_16]|nr:MAG: hypothetical protein COV20_04190 [Candidatus Woesearchaeota archaeon CG10_big_fil_rev_8_21_14_0_10_45_16]